MSHLKCYWKEDLAVYDMLWIIIKGINSRQKRMDGIFSKMQGFYEFMTNIGATQSDSLILIVNYGISDSDIINYLYMYRD